MISDDNDDNDDSDDSGDSGDSGNNDDYLIFFDHAPLCFENVMLGFFY